MDGCVLKLIRPPEGMLGCFHTHLPSWCFHIRVSSGGGGGGGGGGGAGGKLPPPKRKREGKRKGERERGR